jgi:hypothetical protein
MPARDNSNDTLQKGTFPYAIAAQQPDKFACAQLQRHMMQHMALSVIGVKISHP